MLTPEVIGVIAAAALAMIGTCMTAYFQYKSSKATAKKEADEEARRRAEEAEKELEKTRKEEEQRQINERFEDLSEKLEKMSKNIEFINGRLDNQKLAFDKRMEQTEASIRMIIQVLSKNAREFSSLMKMHQQTETRLQIMMNIETQNLKFSKELSSTLGTIAEVLSHSLNDDEAVAQVRDTIESSKLTDKQFMDAILEAQKDFFAAQVGGQDRIVTPTNERSVSELNLFGNNFNT